MPVKQISARLEVLAVGEISVIYAFPVADEDITDNAEVKYEEHLCLHTCQDFLGFLFFFFLFFFFLSWRGSRAFHSEQHLVDLQLCSLTDL